MLPKAGSSVKKEPSSSSEESSEKSSFADFEAYKCEWWWFPPYSIRLQIRKTKENSFKEGLAIEQVRDLDTEFEDSQKPSNEDMGRIYQKIKLSAGSVKEWFKKSKRQR